mmetsp:Transcript_5473/g.7072  ORF Transcript_5473/g.7072 Transcript_5473/m.7072 type:complete len:234 (+) Transcript_5473:43-744(+)|eukprot:CAMPEP_0201480838 /NCGR_PEP_ID=MMETSP0151_2-20130828/5231_1 /ASSEMBLY_ACC=CAM_ASM_000257 /TAXON_ID=200890 /ORGANISM="Paramoeba atlantica, Strain 621/1 / CCAP 1560/9" /LENGTH=233 /DNA_ID=CAMNT_0047862813 /DNA_START=43 /DNA_END=744 /DNA_ORIENTATION=+
MEDIVPIDQITNHCGEDEGGVLIRDSTGLVHMIPKPVAATISSVWSKISQSRNPIDINVADKTLHYVILYLSTCVCHRVAKTEQIEKGRKTLRKAIQTEKGLLKNLREAAVTLDLEILILCADYSVDLSDFESLEKAEQDLRSRAYDLVGKEEEKKLFRTLEPLTQEEEQIAKTVSVGKVTWVGAGGPKEEPDLSFGWMNKDDPGPPPQLQATEIVDNETSSPMIIDNLEEVL